MRRIPPVLWPVLVTLLTLVVTASLWSHERRMDGMHLRSSFDFGLRQTAVRIEQRMASYEQMLRGTRGLFEASNTVTAADFAHYVDALLAGADAAGLRTIGWAPAAVTSTTGGAPAMAARVAYLAPAHLAALDAIGSDLFAEPQRRNAMLLARDSGRVTLTPALRPSGVADGSAEPGFMLVVPLYDRGRASNTLALRRAHIAGWVFAAFQIGDLMSSLYGEDTPGLEVSVFDGVDLGDATRLVGPPTPAADASPARFEAQEYIAFAGRTWTLLVRSKPGFEQRYSNDSARIIATAGVVLSLLLGLVTWQLVTGRERAAVAARTMTRELRQSAQRYRRIVETANEGIWTVDADGRTTFVNPKMQEMLGLPGADLTGRPWADFMPDEDRAALAGPAPGQRDVGFRRADGTTLWATVSSSPIHNDAGHHGGALAMVTDISERMHADDRRAQLEVQLRQSQKMEAIGTLAGGIAHDFNNILAAILGNVALLRQDIGENPPAVARLEQIGRAGDRARSLVQQIVAFSRQQPQEHVSQPLAPLLEEAARLLRSTLPARVELEVRLAATPLRVHADATQLQQVLMNLCTNAWHAMDGGGGHIVVGLEPVLLGSDAAGRLGGVQPGRHAHVWVRDDGCGMDEATLQRIFEPFYTTKPVGQGTGLGLAVVHGIVIAHGGAMSVTSEPGVGSTFDLYLPLAPSSPVAAADRDDAVPAPAGRGQHVLYVDDDPVMGLMVESLLERSGYRVTCIDDPRRALEIASLLDDPVDVVVSDFNMPELSGIDVARALAAARPTLPVIITTGYVSDSLRTEAQALGVRQVLQKEYTLEQLGALVHQALAPPAGAA